MDATTRFQVPDTETSSVNTQDRTQSRFRIFSIGTAAENLPRNSERLEISPLEQLPKMNGELTQKEDGYRAASSDHDGQAYEENASITATINAKWLPLGQSNRMTPPNVRRGEDVIIYQFADADEYYWDARNNQVGLRKLETVVWAFSGTADESDNNPTPENCYVMELSTHDGYVKLTTSKKNGEPYAYTIELNTKEGKYTLKDDIDNSFTLDSKQNHFKMQNAKGSFLEIKQEAINMQAKTITMNGKQSVMTDSPSITLEGMTGVKGDISSTSGKYGGNGKAGFSGDVLGENHVSLVHHVHRDSGGKGNSGKPI